MKWNLKIEEDEEMYPESYISIDTENNKLFPQVTFWGKKETGRLIAAAPELLEACKMAKVYLMDAIHLLGDSTGSHLNEGIINKLDQAINKAENRESI